MGSKLSEDSVPLGLARVGASSDRQPRPWPRYDIEPGPGATSLRATLRRRSRSTSADLHDDYCTCCSAACGKAKRDDTQGPLALPPRGACGECAKGRLGGRIYSSALRAVHFGPIWYIAGVSRLAHDWFKRRHYCHFDYCVNEREAELLVSDPNKVAKHNFWPLLWYFEKSRIWKRAPAPRNARQPLTGDRPNQLKQARAIARRERAGRPSRSGRWKTKLRPIAYASHRDSAIFAYYAYLLQRPYEELLKEGGISDCVLAYRAVPRTLGKGGKSNYDFAAEAFAEVARHCKCEVVCMDLKSFFDTLPHREIKRQWKRLCRSAELPPDHYAVFRAATRYSRVPVDKVRRALKISVRAYKRMRMNAAPFPVDVESFHRIIRSQGLVEANTGPGRRGIPQGLPISGLLANIAMLSIDARMHRLASVCKATYRRYSDDVLIIAPCGCAQHLATAMRKLVAEAGMTVQPDKTTFHDFRRDRWGVLRTARPLQYLGFQFDGQRVAIRPNTLARFGKRMRKAIRTAGRIAGRRWDGVGTVKIKRRKLYNSYSPLPYLWAASDKKPPRGSFTHYARRAKAAVQAMPGAEEFIAQMLKQLRRRMKQLDSQIKAVEKEQTAFQRKIREAERKRREKELG